MISRVISPVLLSAILLFGSSIAADKSQIEKGEFGAARPSSKPGKPSVASSSKSYPFHGYVAEVKAAEGVVALRGQEKQRLIRVTDSTGIFMDKQKAALSQLSPGVRVTGSVRKNENGQEEALTLRFATVPK